MQAFAGSIGDSQQCNINCEPFCQTWSAKVGGLVNVAVNPCRFNDDQESVWLEFECNSLSACPIFIDFVSMSAANGTLLASLESIVAKDIKLGSFCMKKK